jgi:hypothetical protein
MSTNEITSTRSDSGITSPTSSIFTTTSYSTNATAGSQIDPWNYATIEDDTSSTWSSNGPDTWPGTTTPNGPFGLPQDSNPCPMFMNTAVGGILLLDCNYGPPFLINTKIPTSPNIIGHLPGSAPDPMLLSAITTQFFNMHHEFPLRPLPTYCSLNDDWTDEIVDPTTHTAIDRIFHAYEISIRFFQLGWACYGLEDVPVVRVLARDGIK